MSPDVAPIAARDLAAWCTAAAREDPALIPELPHDPAGAERLARVLLANRLGLAITRLLPSTASAPRSALLIESIRDDARLSTERALAGLAALRAIAAALDARAIPWLLWKGPALSMQVWSDPTRRRFTDLDIVVAPDSRAGALAALRDAGWRIRDSLPDRTAHAVHAGTCAYPLEREGAPLVELHWRFGSRLYPAFARVEDVIARAEPLRLAGGDVRTPGGADALFLLAAHATKHGWSQAEEVVSFARLVARDRAALGPAREAAARAGVPRVVALAERLAARLTGDAPEHHRDDRALEAMADECLGRMCAGDGAWRETKRWTLAWIARPSDKARFLAGAVWRPTPLEARWVALPEPLAPAYPAVRIARLTLKALGLGGRA